MVNVVAECEFATEQHRFFERLNNGRGARSDLHAETEFLSAAAEFVAGVEQIEIALLKFGKSGNAFDRGEAGAERERARASFANGDAHIFLRGNSRVDGLNRNVIEIACRFQAALGSFHAHHVKNFAGRDDEVAQKNFRFGNVVPVDRDGAQIGFFAFGNFENQIDFAGFRIRLFGYGNACVQVADFAVIFANFLHGNVNGGGRIPRARENAVEVDFVAAAHAARGNICEHRNDAFFREPSMLLSKFVPVDFDVADGVAATFVDCDFDG